MSQDSIIKKGYKQTEIGVIPEDWEVKKLKEIAHYRRGSFPQPYGLPKWYSDYVGFPFVQVFDVDDNFKLKNDTQRKISLEAQKYSILAKKGTVILTIQGSIGRVAVTQYDTYVDRTLLIFESFNKPISIQWFIYVIFILFKREKELAPGGIIKTITKEALGQFLLGIPPLPEQSAIATILSDTDALIEHLNTLIEKKKAIKQGTMQQVLTGKRRLPGFTGEWETKKLGQIGEIITGSTPPTTVREYWNGQIPWITPTDISNRKDIFNSERKISIQGLQVIRKLPIDTLLVTCIASIGKNAILRTNGASNQQINAIIPNEKFNVDYLYYLMEINKQYLLSKAGITATLMISKKDFSEIYFSFPSTKSEQTAIATILSDMDLEIDNLEAKRNKYQSIKQGMMQQLLTGNIRVYGNN